MGQTWYYARQGEQAGSEHVHLAGREPAGQVAPPGRSSERADDQQVGLGQRQLQLRGVQDDGDVVGHVGEHTQQALARALEQLEHRHGVARVALIVARGERGRAGLGPGHRSAV